MHKNKYLYVFRYDKSENALCKLESKYIFDKEEKNKFLFSNKKIDPSSSAFIKRRLDIISSSKSYTTLLNLIKSERICTVGFKVEYLVLNGDKTEYALRLNKLKDVGYSIDAIPDYYNPTTTYAICYHGDTWYFGTLNRNNFAWEKHKQKPKTFSNSLNISIAKALVNIAANSNKETEILDACCGVGTIMLEACYEGYNIEGCDINWKICRNARENLSHFNYSSKVYCTDINDLSKRYDVAILDLPYNLYSAASDDQILHIIKSVAAIADRLVIVSISDIKEIIKNIGFKILDYCNTSKGGKSNFTRNIWVCAKYGAVHSC